MNRGLRAATAGLLLLVPITLAGCSAGQVNQTSSQNRDKVGSTVDLGGSASVHAINLLDPTLSGEKGSFAVPPAYEAGEDAELTFVLSNDGNEAIRLSDVSAEGFRGAFSTAVSGALPADGGGSQVDIDVPAKSSVRVGFRPSASGDVTLEATDRRVVLTGLQSDTAPLTSGALVHVTFTIEGEDPVGVDVTVNGPTDRANPSGGFGPNADQTGDDEK